MFTEYSSGLRGFRDMVTDLSQSPINAASSSQASKALVAKTSASRADKYVTPRSRGYMDWPKLKRLQFSTLLTIERIQADLETFAISYGIRTHINQMTASSRIDNEPDDSQMRTFSAPLE